MANLIPEFTKRDVKVIALSCDTVTAHKGWITDIKVNRTLGGFVCIDTLCRPPPPTHFARGDHTELRVLREERVAVPAYRGSQQRHRNPARHAGPYGQG